jgi:hypothetical protein
MGMASGACWTGAPHYCCPEQAPTQVLRYVCLQEEGQGRAGPTQLAHGCTLHTNLAQGEHVAKRINGTTNA